MSADPIAAGKVLPAMSRRVLILYGSETGNSQDFAIDLEKVTERLRFRADVCAMDDVGLVGIIPSILLKMSSLRLYCIAQICPPEIFGSGRLGGLIYF